MSKAKPTMEEDWRTKALREASRLLHKGKGWKDFPSWLKFRIRLMNFIWDWLTWDAVKSGWKMPRLQFKSWLLYKKYPFLKETKL